MSNLEASLQRLKEFEETVAKIKFCVPGITEAMILTFRQSHGASLPTVCLWAQQGALKLDNGKIIKVEPPVMTDAEIAAQLKAIADWNPATDARAQRWLKGRRNT